ncbi:hypothetical protein HNQ80_004822 [Anaerosolibacter carboniphilus]|uniref:Uncharacterized protein n=1 Tax=Anaerosolibacter carboniphilus TaxID=1417629 RepID=A0A841L205_9FIRM|nr:hypothetical protein [Anaerosolibacter carboniphilus]MBB6218648.1 hypothetical protein [Anaerosolibacter carboniphilus]
METTQNYNLKKPGQEDFYNVDDFNYNSDVVDAELKKLETEVVERPGPATIILNTYDKRVQSIMAKVASCLNFELNGNMVVNLLGKSLNLSINFERADGTFSGGEFSFSDNTLFRAIDKNNICVADKYYFTRFNLSNITNAGGLFLNLSLLGLANVSFSTTGLHGSKFKPTITEKLRLYLQAGSSGIAKIKELMLIEITADEYNNMTVDQLLEKYHYVNSAQPTLNPVIDIVQGKNLFDKSNILRGKQLNTAGALIDVAEDFTSSDYIPVKPNTTYTLSSSIAGVMRFGQYDDNKNWIVRNATSSASVYQFTTGPTTKHAKISANLTMLESLQLEEGTVATTYEPFRGTKTIVPTMLGKIGSYVDKLKYENGVFKKIKKVEKLILDGSLTWSFSADYAGFKRVSIPNTFNLFDNNLLITKYNGAILLGFTSTWDKADMHGYGSYLNITVADTDTGWGESYTPTADEIKAFFMGWKMYDSAANPNGTVPYNGTGTKAWAYRRESDGALTGGTTTLPTTQAPINNYWQPYTLYYALAQPVEEIINIPSICELPTLSEGINTIAVSSGLVYERVNPALNSGYYHINYAGLSSQLKNKPKNILKVIRVKDGVMTDDTQNWIFLYVSTAYGGVVRCYITQTTYDSLDRVGAEYWVLYEVLPEEYNAQLFDGTGTHAENLRTAHEMAQETVKNLQKQAVRQIDYHSISQKKDDPHGLAFKGARVRLTANQSIANAGTPAISWNASDIDNIGAWNGSTRLTVPTGVSKVRLLANVVFEANANGYRGLLLRKNANDFNGRFSVRLPANTSTTELNAISPVLDVVGGDYFELFVTQNSGSAISVTSNSATWFAMEVIE